MAQNESTAVSAPDDTESIDGGGATGGNDAEAWIDSGGNGVGTDPPSLSLSL